MVFFPKNFITTTKNAINMIKLKIYKNKIFLLKIKKIHCFINKKLFNIEIK